MRGARRRCQPDPGATRPPKPMDSVPGGPQGTQRAPTEPRPPSNCSVRPPQRSRPGSHRPQQTDRTPPGCTDNEPHPAPRTPAHRSTGQPATPPVPPQTAPDPKLDPQPIRPAPHCRPHPNGQAHPARQQNTPPWAAPSPHTRPPAREGPRPREHKETLPPPGTQGEQSRLTCSPGETAQPRDPPESQGAGPDSRERGCT
ncbi:proline-rich protein HaeIII subfamily 1-like [Epinephelus fuscoguttatus]|uniref:proline-rich protein HaeIII subfamily 1-like n=1 Tax=Epinephelus fuscoguttatus TaxID=293821 RepID=UPI0020D175D0|nr:proline-rich protein HaeIII subfamily 1-like [Epinephelus fuscoguttatus]